MIDSSLAQLEQGDRRALSRLLSLVARGEGLEEILARLGPPKGHSRVVAITGGGGVGKSTLIGKLIEHLRKQELRVAVLACDPASPLTGGALLGDRFRMPSRPDDDGVFIRSLAATAGRGAIAEHLRAMVRLLEAFGFDVIVIETVGAGQGDTAVRALADVVVLLLQPETGDDLQWEKAGLLEVADVVAIHKADLPGAEAAEAQVRASLGLAGQQAVPVLRVSARTGQGVEELWRAVAQCPSRHEQAFNARELLRLAQEALSDRFTHAEAAQHPALQVLMAQWRQGTLSDETAGEALLHLLESIHGPRG